MSGRTICEETFWWGKVFEKKYGLETAVKMSKAEIDLKNRFALHFCSCNQNYGATCCSYFHYQWGHVLEMHEDFDSAFQSVRSRKGGSLGYSTISQGVLEWLRC